MGLLLSHPGSIREALLRFWLSSKGTLFKGSISSGAPLILTPRLWGSQEKVSGGWAAGYQAFRSCSLWVAAG